MMLQLFSKRQPGNHEPRNTTKSHSHLDKPHATFPGRGRKSRKMAASSRNFRELSRKWALCRVSWGVEFSGVACNWRAYVAQAEDWQDSVIRFWDKVLGLGQVRVGVVFPGPLLPYTDSLALVN